MTSSQNNHYAFIEIGTSDFATLTTQKKYKDQRGLSVEPIKKLLDRLPTNPNHIKVCKALDATSGEAKFYKYKDEYMEVPANAGKYTDYERGMSCLATTDNLKKRITNSVRNKRFEVVNVPTINWVDLIKEFKIGSVDYLKIDTEGLDAYVLIELHKTELRPYEIKFEYCHHSEEVVQQVLRLWSDYKIKKKTKNDIYLIDTKS